MVQVNFEVNDNMIGRIHEMFELDYIVDHFTSRDKVRILYPSLNLSCLPSVEKNMNEFLAKINKVGLEAHE